MKTPSVVFQALSPSPCIRLWLVVFWLGLTAALWEVGHAAEPSLISARNGALPLALGGNGDSVAPVLSPDGRFVLFSSTASDLVTNDNAWLSLDVFLHDRASNVTMLVSENLQHTGGGNDHSTAVGVSTNGRYVLFESVASDLVSGDTNGLNDVFVRDCQTETTHLVSATMGGGMGNDRSETPVMTPDGRYVAFVSYATNLVTNDTNGIPDVFVRDLQTQSTTLVSVGATNANSSMGTPVISPDGRWVAFFSTARGIVAGVSNVSRGEIYLRDLATSTTLWPSTNAIALVRSAMQFNSVPMPTQPVISADGRYVVFACGWTNNAVAPPSGTTFGTVLIEFDATTRTAAIIDTNGYPPALFGDDVYGPEMTPDGRFVTFAARVANGLSARCVLRCWDRLAGTNVAVSVDLTGALATNSTSVAPVLSADGRYVTFVSDATNLVSNVISNDSHIYRRDLWSNITELVDADLAGVGSTVGLFDEIPTCSADGTLIAFSAPDGELADDDNNGREDVFVWHATAGTNELISLRHPAQIRQTGNAMSLPGLVSISADGNRVAFASAASDLVADDTNKAGDVFVWNRLLQTNLLVSVGSDGLPATGGASFQPQISSDGRYVLFQSFATNLVSSGTNGQFHVFLRDLQLQVTTLVSVTTNGVSLGSYDAPRATMSPDAQRVVFVSRTNTGSTYLTFWRDLSSGETRLLTGAADSQRQPTLSTNGMRVAYFDTSARLYVWDAIGQTNLYTNTAAISSAAISPGGNRVLYQSNPRLYCYDLNVRSNLNSWLSTVVLKTLPVWSPDERFVTFVTASNLVSGDTNAANDVYLCDLQNGTLSLISANASGTGSANGASDAPSFSGDGRFIAYRSFATNLLPAGSVPPGVFVFDRATGSNTLVVARSPLPGLSWISWPAINDLGDTIAFKTMDAGLVTGDLNQTVDAFAGSVSVLSLADGDSDGIPDWWLQQYFGHTNGQAGDLSRAGDDADDDGLTNGQEFLAGTDPTDEDSALWMEITMTPPSGTNVVLSWPAKPGKSYRVQFTDDVAAANWQDLSTVAQVVGDWGQVSVNRTNLARVFRVRCEQ